MRDGLPCSLHPMSFVMPRTYYEQNLGAYVEWSIHHIIWQGSPYELWYRGELHEDRHWREYQRRLQHFYETGKWDRSPYVL